MQGQPKPQGQTMLPNKLTLTQVKKIVKKELESEQLDKQLFEEIRELLSTYEGKTITRRIKSKLPEKFKLSDYGVPHTYNFVIKVSKRSDLPEHQKDYFSVNIMHGEFTLEKFDRDNRCYISGTHERIMKLRAVLQSPEALKEYVIFSKKMYELIKLTDSLNKGTNTGNKCPAHHNIIKSMNMTSNLYRELAFYKGLS